MKTYLHLLATTRKHYNFIQHKKREVCADIITFDIETTTYFKTKWGYMSEKEIIEVCRCDDVEMWANTAEKIMQESEAGAVCYLWQFGVNDNFYFGRDLPDFKTLLDFLADKKIYCKIFVHNLSYEYFFLKGIIPFDKVFFTDLRSVLYCEYRGHIFACTYKLTNLSLAQWGKQLKCEKLTTLDYNAKIRTPRTKLEQKEIDYGERDLKVMQVGLAEYVGIYGDVWNIPYTQTGILRRDIKKTFQKNIWYHDMLADMLPKTADDLKFLQKTFSGAIVISNVKNTNKILSGVSSYDKTSAYPFTLCCKKFPRSEFTYADTNTDIFREDGLHHIYVIKFYNLVAKYSIRTIPSSKRICAVNMKLDNGKVISAREYECFCTELDVKTIDMFYHFDRYEVKIHKVAKSGYLHKDLVLLFLEYYKRKTKYKGVAGMEVYYMQQGKVPMNAGYGCTATNPVKPEILAISKDAENIINGFSAPEIDKDTKTDYYISTKLMNKYCHKWNELVAYSWGIYVTSWQRFLLCEMIKKIIDKAGTSEVFCYSDTDCIKGFLDEYKYLFDAENEKIENEIKALCEEREIDFDLFQPADVKGDKHLLGVWDFEERYYKFKSLGQKRYAFITEKDFLVTKRSATTPRLKVNMVVSGVPKLAPAPETLDEFSDGLRWDIFNSHKILIQYKDGNNLQVTLNKGKKDEYAVKNPCAVTMRNMSYNMSLARDYKELIGHYLQQKR